MGHRGIVLLCVVCSLAFAQRPVTGSVSDDITGAPIANARIGLFRETSYYSVRSDATGRFFLNIPDGTYRLGIEKAGFFPITAETVQVSATGPGDLTLILTKMRTIRGRFLFREGDPPYAGPVIRRPGDTNTLNIVSVRQDSRGSFVQDDLRPGLYEIVVISPEGPAVAGISISGSTYYPREIGKVIDIRNTAEVDIGDVYLDRPQGVTVSGNVRINPKIRLESAPQVTLSSPRITGATRMDLSAGVLPDGSFRLENVPPGPYILSGHIGLPVTFGGRIITVGADLLQGLQLILDAAPPLLKVDVQKETTAGLQPVALVAMRTNAPALGSLFPGFTLNTNAKGYAPLSPATPDPEQELVILPNPSRPLPEGYITVTQGNRTQTRDPFTVSLGDDEVHVVFKADGGKVNGQVRLPGNPPRPAFIVLAPKERAAKLFYRTATTDRLGTFQLTGIAPGDYDLFAFDREDSYSGEPTLLQYATSGVRVAVAPLQEQAVSPNLVRITK